MELGTEVEIDDDKVSNVEAKLEEQTPKAWPTWKNIRAALRRAAGERKAEVEEAEALRDKKDALRNQINTKKHDQAVRGERLASDDAAIEKDEERVKKIIAQINVLFSKNQRDVLNPLKWASTLPDDVSFRQVAVKLSDKPTEAALKSCQNARLDFLAEIKRIESAPVTFEEAHTAGVAQIKRVSAAGRMNVRGLFAMHDTGVRGKRRQGRIVFPDHQINIPGSPIEYNALEFAVWLHEPLVLQRFEEMLKECAPQDMIAIADRPARIAEIRTILSKLEYEEGALISALEEAHGRVIDRRFGMDVPAALGIEVVRTRERK